MTHHSHLNFIRPASLRELGVTPPPGWSEFVEGERLDWLSAVAAAASREFNRIDVASLAASRAELTKIHSKTPSPWSVAA